MKISQKTKDLVDIKAKDGKSVTFGDNKLLRTLGAVVFGLATKLALPKVTKATHVGWAAPPCYGLAYCHSSPGCPGYNCTPLNTVSSGACQVVYGTGYTAGQNCWYSYWNGRLISCCDFRQLQGNIYNNCIVRTVIY